MINIDVFKDISYGMYIVGSLDGEREVGCIVNSIMQITSQNPTIAISVNHDNYTNKCIEETRLFSVSILPETVDRNVISTFGFSSSKDNNKWENTEYIKVDNMPVLKESCGYMICQVVDKLETDTHTVFLGKVNNLAISLLFFSGLDKLIVISSGILSSLASHFTFLSIEV